MIVLQVKCPQLSKPEATAARNQNSIGDRMEKKPWEKPGSVGGPVPLRPDESVVLLIYSLFTVYTYNLYCKIAKNIHFTISYSVITYTVLMD